MTGIDHEKALPMLQTVIPILATPGNQRQLMMRVHICLSQFVSAENTPIIIKGLDIVAIVETQRFVKSSSSNLVLFLL